MSTATSCSVEGQDKDCELELAKAGLTDAKAQYKYDKVASQLRREVLSVWLLAAEVCVANC